MLLLSTTPRRITITRVGLIAKAVLIASTMLGCRDTAPKPVHTPPLTEAQSTHYALIQAGETGPARIRIRQRMAGGDQDSRWLFLMGLAHHWDRHYARAAEWLARAEAAEPRYPPASHFLGWALYHGGHAPESRAAFERHLEMVPTEGDSHFALGVLAIERGDWSAADAALRSAIAHQEDDPGRAGGVAKAMARRSEVVEQRDGDLNGAVTLLAQAVARDPDLYEAHFRLARLLRRLGRELAAEAADEAGRAAQARAEANRVRP